MPPTTPDALADKLKRTEIQRASSSIPGREIVQVITEIPAGVQPGWHQHSGEEVGYILEGTVRMEIAGQNTIVLGVGRVPAAVDTPIDAGSRTLRES